MRETFLFMKERNQEKNDFIDYVKNILSCDRVKVYKDGEFWYEVEGKNQKKDIKEHKKRYRDSEKKIVELLAKEEKKKKVTMKARSPEMVERIKAKNKKIVQDFFKNKNNPDVFEVALIIKCVPETIYAIQRTGLLPKKYATQLQREISSKLKEV